MKLVSRSLAPASLIVACLIIFSPVRADEDQGKEANRYVRNDLVSDVPIKGMNPATDPVLRNAWGVAFTPGASPFWIADNASGCATLYDGTGVKVTTVQVAIPLPDNSVPSTACQPASAQTDPPPPSPAAPTGLVWNPTTSSYGLPGSHDEHRCLLHLRY